MVSSLSVFCVCVAIAHGRIFPYTSGEENLQLTWAPRTILPRGSAIEEGGEGPFLLSKAY